MIRVYFQETDYLGENLLLMLRAEHSAFDEEVHFHVLILVLGF